MIAVFHTEQPNGRYLATSESYPTWTCEASSLDESRALAEDSLLAHIAQRTVFSHYVVPRLQAA